VGEKEDAHGMKTVQMTLDEPLLPPWSTP